MRKLPKEEHVAPEPISGPSKDEIEDQFNEAVVLDSEGRDPYPGSNYVGGVKAALAWVMGESDEPPMGEPF